MNACSTPYYSLGSYLIDDIYKNALGWVQARLGVHSRSFLFKVQHHEQNSYQKSHS
jgi:hypothetical protein